MNAYPRRSTVWLMNFRDQPPPSVDGPPRALRALGLIAMATVVASTFLTDPKPSVNGDGPLVILGIVLLVGGLGLAYRRREWFPGARLTGLALVGTATLIFASVQPDSAGYAGVYFVMALGGIRLSRDAAILVCGGTVAGLVGIQLLEHQNAGMIAGLLFSVLPWFLVMRLIRRLGTRNRELQDNRAAHAQSAALGERQRVARELHDVLAHSLSALALQLEGTRLLARDRGADPEVVEGLERAHHLAVSGLTEARQAISALRGDLPALEDLAGTFPNATFTVTGTPRDASSEARLALYRTAQEALTNVRRHSASGRVELKLAYEADGTTLTVQDHGTAAPVIGGRGYGLTGMRERAELLGGRLNAGPTDDGFRVELWLPLLRADHRANPAPGGPSSPLRS
jgi:signal transduction histidine kinase